MLFYEIKILLFNAVKESRKINLKYIIDDYKKHFRAAYGACCRFFSAPSLRKMDLLFLEYLLTMTLCSIINIIIPTLQGIP